MKPRVSLFFCILSCLPFTPNLLPLAGAEESYQGKYLTHPGWPVLERLVETWRPDAVKAVEMALGLKAPEDFEVEIVFQDMPLSPNGSIKTATTTTVIRKGRSSASGAPGAASPASGRTVQRIVFHPELYFGHLVEMKTEILHEMTHAVLRALLGARHRPLPKWVREGLAVWVAKQGEEKIILNLASYLHEDRPIDRLVNGLEGGHQIKDYAEDYLAFAYLESWGGPRVIRSFVRQMVDGRTYREALAAVTEKDWETFQREVRRYTETELGRYLGEDHAAYQEAFQRYRQSRFEAALKVFEPLAAKRDSPFLPQYRYYYARSLQQVGRVKDAEEALKALWTVESGPRLGGLMDETTWHYAECAKSQGWMEEAAKRYDQVVQHYPFSPLAPRALYEQVAAWVSLNDSQETRRALGQLTRYYPQSPWTARALAKAPQREEEADAFEKTFPSSSASLEGSDEDGFTYLKPSKPIRLFIQRLEEALKTKDWDGAVELLSTEWRPEAFEEVPVEREDRPGSWVGFSQWMAEMVKRLPPAQAKEVLGVWDGGAKISVRRQDPSWDMLKTAFEWPGELSSKHQLLGKAGLLAWDEGQREFGWLMVQRSGLPALTGLKSWAATPASGGLGPVPPLARQWVWKAPAPPSTVVPTPSRLWVVLKDGRLLQLDPTVGTGDPPGLATGILHIPLERSRSVVRWNPTKPVIPLNFIDLILEEYWTAYLPEEWKKTANQNSQPGKGAPTGPLTVAEGSSEERLYFVETQTQGLGIGREMILHACLGATPHLKWLWSKSLGQVGVESTLPDMRPQQQRLRNQPVQLPSKVVMVEAGPQWMALNGEQVLLAGNVFTGAIEWMWEVSPPVEAQVPPGRPAASQGSLTSPVIRVEGEAVVCSLPTWRAACALDSRTGRLIWWKSFESEPVLVDVSGGRAIIGLRDEIVTYDVKTGKEGWRLPALEGAVRNGMVRSGGGRLYVPWGKFLSVVDTSSGKLLGSVERAFTGWGSLALDGEGLYEIADEGIAAWRPAQEFDRLQTAWKERQDLEALGRLAAFSWLNNREEEALEYLVTWWQFAAPTQSDRLIQQKRLIEWVLNASSTTVKSPVWSRAWKEVLRLQTTAGDAVGVWQLARLAEQAQQREMAITAYQSLLVLAPQTPKITTLEGSSFTVSLIVNASLDRLKGGPKEEPAALLQPWRRPLREAWSCALSAPPQRLIATPHGVVAVLADSLQFISQEAPTIKWTLAIKGDVPPPPVAPRRGKGQVQVPRGQTQVQVAATPEYLAVMVPGKSMTLLDLATGIPFKDQDDHLKEFGLPKDQVSVFVVGLSDGVAVFQTQSLSGKTTTQAAFLDRAGRRVMKDQKPAWLEMGSALPQMAGGWAPAVSQGDRLMVLNQEGAQSTVTAYRKEGLTKDWSYAVNAAGQRAINALGLKIVDDHLIAVVMHDEIRLLDQASGQIAGTISNPVQGQVVAIGPNRLVVNGQTREARPAHKVVALDYRGETMWAHPGSFLSAGESVVIIRQPQGTVAMHDLQSGAEIDVLPTTNTQLWEMGNRPPVLYVSQPNNPPKITAFLPAK